VNRTLLLLAFISISISSNAGNWLSMPERVAKHRIYLDADYSFASNAVTNNFAKDYYRGVFITNERKDEVSKNLDSYNRFGLQVNTRAAFNVGFDSLFGLKNSWLTFSISDHYLISSSFKKDVFELYFRGNKNYAGSTADLSHFSLNQFRYQQFSIGFGHQFTKDRAYFSYYAGLSLTKGNDLLTIRSDETSLYTDPYGESLFLEADITLQRSDSSARTWKAWKGTGVGTDLQFNWTDSSNNQFSISVYNFGFTTWNKRSTVISSDTAFNFYGVDVSNIFDFTSSVRSDINLDSSLVQPYLKERTSRSITTLMPGRFVVSYTSSIKSRLLLNITADHYWMADYLPSVVISPGFHLPAHTFWLTTRFGGYGGFFAGLAYQFHANNWEAGIRSEYLSGILDPNGRGQGAVFSIARSF
jgi:hypothetical protein